MVDHNQHLQFRELISWAGMHSAAKRHKCIGFRGNLEKQWTKNMKKWLIPFETQAALALCRALFLPQILKDQIFEDQRRTLGFGECSWTKASLSNLLELGTLWHSGVSHLLIVISLYI